MIDEIPVESFTRKGNMTKAPWLMSEEEYREWEVQVQERAKSYLFSIGQPLVYKKDGQCVAEFGDGRIKIIR